MLKSSEELLLLHRPKVLVAVPNSGEIHKLVSLATIRMLQDTRCQVTVIYPTRSPTVENRHRIAVDFLAGEYDFLISIDSDNPPKNNPLDLVFLDLDVIGCPTPVWHDTVAGGYPIYWNCMVRTSEGYKVASSPKDVNIPVEVDAVGMGCIVIARRVLTALQFSLPFEDHFDKDGFRDRGHDYYFCDKVKNAGFKVWAHYNYPCQHFNTVELTSVIAAFSAYYTLDHTTNKYTKLRESLQYDNYSIDKIDFDILTNFLKRENFTRILEYGPGVSTELFKMFGDVHSIENKNCLRPTGQYDLAFIDGPIGTVKLSREASVVEAMSYTNVIILHDTYRPGEQETIKKHLKSWNSNDMGSERGMHVFRRAS